MNTQDLKHTAAAAYLLINALKSILEQEGYELDTVVFSVNANLKDGSAYQGKEYRLGEELEKNIHQLQAISAMEDFTLVPKEPTEEMLNTAWECPPIASGLTRRNLFAESLTVVYRSMVEAAQLTKEDLNNEN